jgi:isopentenyl diphosphate isomerase/L-lactate dehydrogenase-like FMN-dependent dehydrogenase
MGGIGTGSSFMANVNALARIKLNMRLVHGVSEPDTSTEFLGENLSLPVLAAPIGGVEFNMGGKISEEDYVSAVLGGCLEAGALGCTGDGVPAFIHETGFKVIKDLGGKGIPFIKPWEDEELYDKMDKALASGAEIVGMDVDAAGLVTLAKMGRPVSPKNRDKLAEIINKVPARFVVKGLMHPEDARLAVDAGAEAVVVSNHGGRVLDHTPGTAEVLPRVARAVAGRAAVVVDGGVRGGVDVLKMLALGADVVMLGRPFAWSAVGGGKAAVAEHLERIRGELFSAMVLTGCAVLADAGPDILHSEG